MRVPSGNLGGAKPVSYLWERHREIARLLVSGERPVDICRRLGYTQSWLSTVMNSPVFKEYLSKLSERKDDQAIDIRKQIEEGAQVGVSALLKILKEEDEYKDRVSVQQKIKIAQDFLDREGHGKITKVVNDTTVKVLTEDRIQSLKERRQAMLANLAPVAIEAEYVTE